MAVAMLQIDLVPVEGSDLLQKYSQLITECAILEDVAAACYKALGVEPSSLNILVRDCLLPFKEWLKTCFKLGEGSLGKAKKSQ